MWLIGAVVCLLAANCESNCESNCSLTRAIDGRIVSCGITSSCQSAATFERDRNSASVHKSVLCKKLYSKYQTLPLSFTRRIYFFFDITVIIIIVIVVIFFDMLHRHCSVTVKLKLIS